MNWNDLELGFQAAFEASWNAFKAGTIPIGSAVLNEEGELVSIGRNRIHETTIETDELQMFNHQLAHAEINAILKLNEKIHTNIRKYTLYSTMEPCPFCFGAIVMGSIRHVKYAARDGWAGATELNTSMNYIKRKRIVVEGPFEGLEEIQITLHSYFELEHHYHSNVVLDSFTTYCPKGVSLAHTLYETKTLREFAKRNESVENIFNYLMNLLKDEK